MTDSRRPSDPVRDWNLQPNVLDELVVAQEVAGNVGGEMLEYAQPELTPLRRVQRLLNLHPVIGTILVLSISVVVFSLWAGRRFYQPFNLSLIMQQVQVVGILALAQGFVVLTAGIDLSVGAIMLLSSIVMGRLAVVTGLPPVLAVVAGLCAGALCGLLNGFFVAKIKLPPFIVTLASLYILGSLLLAYSRSETIRNQDLPPFLLWMGRSVSIGGARITYGVFAMLVLYGLAWYALRWTAWGQHVYATGDNPEAALLTGVSTQRVLLSVYVVSGIIAALAGWVLIARAGSVSSRTDPEHNLNSVTAVVIGGLSLFGGRGTVWGALFGALIVGSFRSGLSQAGVDVLWQNFAIGCLILAAVSLERWIRKAGA
jgi:fructose transport system permease protein